MTLRSSLTSRLSESQKQTIRRLTSGERAKATPGEGASKAKPAGAKSTNKPGTEQPAARKAETPGQAADKKTSGEAKPSAKKTPGKKIPATPPEVEGSGPGPVHSAAIDAFDRKAISLEDVPDHSPAGELDLISLHNAFSRYRNYERANLAAELILSRDPLFANHMRVTRSLLALNRPDDALQRLEGLDPNTLSKEARRQRAHQAVKALRLLGRHDEALELARGVVKQSPNSIESRMQIIDVLRDFHLDDEVPQHFNRLLASNSPSTMVLNKHLDWLHSTNRLDELERRLDELTTRNPKSADLAWRLSRLYWLTGNEAGFQRSTRTTVALATERLPPAGAINFYTTLFPGHDGWEAQDEFKDALAERLYKELLPLGVGRPHGPDWTLPRIRAAKRIENLDFVTEYADYTMEHYPYVPQSYIALAEVATIAGNYDEAQSYLSACAEFDETDPELHVAKFELELLRSGDTAKLEEILAHRDAHASKFNEYLPDGRPRYYDREMHTLHKRRGDYAASYAMHANQVHNRFLANRYPKKYRPQDHDLLGPKKLGKVTVVGLDGVSDEVRWAQHLPFLVENSTEVSLTCDPRLESLFARSFPTVQFRGVRRYPAYFPRVGATDRELVDQIYMAAKADNQLLEELDKTDRIVLLEEIAVQRWKNSNLPRPSADDPSLNNSVLVPDPELVASWKKRLAADAGDRGNSTSSRSKISPRC